jgi:hypothetical protein
MLATDMQDSNIKASAGLVTPTENMAKDLTENAIRNADMIDQEHVELAGGTKSLTFV